MVQKTINEEELQVMSNIEHPEFEEVSDYCLNILVDIAPIKIVYQEFSEEEFMTLPEKIGIFSFLDDPEEDVYTPGDGQPLT